MTDRLRTRPARLAAAAALAAAGLACSLFLAANRRAAGADTTGPAVTRPTFAPAFTAMTYYDQSSANCHGPHGAFYGPTLGNDLTDAALVRKCRDMAKGPGNAPLEADDNAVVTAYHRSLIRGTPFLSVTDVADGQWTGEVTAGAKVTLRANGRPPVAATVDGWNWTAPLPAGTAPATVVVDATLNAKTTELHPADSAYSDTPRSPRRTSASTDAFAATT